MKARRVFRIAAFVVSFMFALRVAAQATSVQVANLPGGQALNMIFYMGPKGTTQPVSATVNSSGPVASLQGLLGSNKPHIAMKSWMCPGPNGTTIIISLPVGEPNPCPDGKAIAGLWFPDNPNTVIFDLTPGSESVAQAPYTPPAVVTGGGGAPATTGGLHTALQIDLTPGISKIGGFKGLCSESVSTGETCTHGTTFAKFNVDGAVLFGSGPITAGPFVAFEWRQGITSALDCPSGASACEGPFTEDESVRINSFDFGAEASFRPGMGPVRFNVNGGEGVLSVNVKVNSTSGSGSSSSSNSAIENSTLGAPFVGFGVVIPVGSHVGFTAGYRFQPVRFDKSVFKSGSSTSAFENALHDNDVLFGVTLFFGGGGK